MVNLLSKVCRLYLHLAAGIFVVVAGVLTVLTIYAFVVNNLSGSEFNTAILLERLKILAALTITLPLVILLVIGFFRGVFKLLGVEANEEDK
ncbi:hypothetical protein [Microbulbifer celer]|uniref:hypothetical protein n=1 Tax=Microbulbifer celer TaxID=435905 RepID=UPI001E4B84D1|nr:hypothetical protein [Microbulbifer celer]UFN55951.1 hypothetical protein LPW13_10205 [Microbulbifer celer]